MLKKLELHNFKSHRHTQVHFDNSRLQAIVGRNSSGKTSILQALYLLSQIFHLEPLHVFDSKNAPEFIITNGQVNMSVNGSGIWGSNSNHKEWKFSYGLDLIKSGGHDYIEPRRTWNIDGN